MKSNLIAATLLCTLVSSTAAAQRPTRAEAARNLRGNNAVALRPIDRATVRVISLEGASDHVRDGARSRSARRVAGFQVSHGTGTLVRRDGLILTAGHVIHGSDMVFVEFAQTHDFLPAQIVYVDEDRDIAFIDVDVPVPSVVELPRAPMTLTIAQHVSTSGYPLTITEDTPAATSGEVSRVNNDGLVQTSMNVNPGNSGGPAFDDQNRLIGVVIARADPRAGGAGVTLIEPIAGVIDAYQRFVKMIPDARRTPDEEKKAKLMGEFLSDDLAERLDDAMPSEGQISRIREGSAMALTPEEKVVVALRAWCNVLIELEVNHAANVGALPAARQPFATELLALARRFAQEALTDAPYLAYHYPFAAHISGPHPAAP